LNRFPQQGFVHLVGRKTLRQPARSEPNLVRRSGFSTSTFAIVFFLRAISRQLSAHSALKIGNEKDQTSPKFKLNS